MIQLFKMMLFHTYICQIHRWQSSLCLDENGHLDGIFAHIQVPRLMLLYHGWTMDIIRLWYLMWGHHMMIPDMYSHLFIYHEGKQNETRHTTYRVWKWGHMAAGERATTLFWKKTMFSAQYCALCIFSILKPSMLYQMGLYEHLTEYPIPSTC